LCLSTWVHSLSSFVFSVSLSLSLSLSLLQHVLSLSCLLSFYIYISRCVSPLLCLSLSFSQCVLSLPISLSRSPRLSSLPLFHHVCIHSLSLPLSSPVSPSLPAWSPPVLVCL